MRIHLLVRLLGDAVCTSPYENPCLRWFLPPLRQLFSPPHQRQPCLQSASLPTALLAVSPEPSCLICLLQSFISVRSLSVYSSAMPFLLHILCFRFVHVVCSSGHLYCAQLYAAPVCAYTTVHCTHTENGHSDRFLLLLFGVVVGWLVACSYTHT